MPRTLGERDKAILSVLAPEFSGESCAGSGNMYRSILPPVANHYARDREDFRERIFRLTPDDLGYLVDLMLSGEESLHCLSPEYFAVLEERIRELAGDEIVRQITARYCIECS